MPRFRVLLALCIGTVAATLVFPLASSAQSETCKFTLLPSLDGGTGNGIKHSDTIVGTYFPTGQAGFRGFIRDSGGRVKTYQVPGSQSTYLTAINDKGVIVGGFNYQPAAQAYGFKQSGRKLTPINYPGAAITNPSGINNKGEIVGTQQVDATGPGRGFLLSKGKFTDIQFPVQPLPAPMALTTWGDRRDSFRPERCDARLHSSKGSVLFTRLSRCNLHHSHRNQRCGGDRRSVHRDEWSLAELCL